MPLFDFEEQSTLGHNLCRTLESSAQARRLPELAITTYGRILCPGARGILGNNGGGELVNVYEPILQFHCRPAWLCNLPDPRFSNLVADRVTLRSQSVSGFSSSALVTGADLVRTVRGTQCTSEIDALRLPNFPNGFEGLLP